MHNGMCTPAPASAGTMLMLTPLPSQMAAPGTVGQQPRACCVGLGPAAPRCTSACAQCCLPVRNLAAGCYCPLMKASPPPPSPCPAAAYGDYFNGEPGRPLLVSLLLYLNDEWRREWGADTLFLDGQTDTGGGCGEEGWRLAGWVAGWGLHVLISSLKGCAHMPTLLLLLPCQASLWRRAPAGQCYSIRTSCTECRRPQVGGPPAPLPTAAAAGATACVACSFWGSPLDAGALLLGYGCQCAACQRIPL